MISQNRAVTETAAAAAEYFFLAATDFPVVFDVTALRPVVHLAVDYDDNLRLKGRALTSHRFGE